MTVYERLEALAYNLRWDWHGPTRDLFRELDPVLWDRVEHNPVALLRRLEPDALNARDGLEERVRRLHEDLDAYVGEANPWYDGDRDPEAPVTAYFSAEFGITESLRIYSGGLGVLAGDHLKSASDLGVPLVAVGLLYREGYFRQAVSPRGEQTESFPISDFEDMPLTPVTRPDGGRLLVHVPLPERRVVARVWLARVGRVRLYLLDTDVPENSDADRAITGRLYGGGQAMRLSQEIVLGMGGYRALREMGVHPRSFHMNEGHSAFLALELVRDIMERDGVGYEEAVPMARRRLLFTTHTPVPAGHDRFPPTLMKQHMTGVAHGLGLDFDAFMDLGRENPGRPDEPFTMTVLAIRLARATNGVAALHGRVSREMWQGLWPERPVDDVPIDHITNGVHLPSWVHPEVAEAAGVDRDRLGIGAPVPEPDRVRLWEIRQERRRSLVEYVRRTTSARLDPEALTIAFARRFATYKRATLLLGDLDRLDALVNAADRPVQFLFSGKAHPKDEPGKAFIRRIGEVARMERFRNRIVFLPDYDMHVARHLVQGADVWLNNPRRPKEASGTSGMKAAANGVLNVSILDGWWDEAWENRDRNAPDPGWAVAGVESDDVEAADRADAQALLHTLEAEVIPSFYDRGPEGRPEVWLDRVGESIRQLAPFFNTHRMVSEYTERYRVAAAEEAPTG